VAINGVNTLEERRAFDVGRSRLIGPGLGRRQLVVLTGVPAFFLSSVPDNLTAALVMGIVVMALWRGNKAVVVIGCISIVVSQRGGCVFAVWPYYHADGAAAGQAVVL